MVCQVKISKVVYQCDGLLLLASHQGFFKASGMEPVFGANQMDQTQK